MVDVLDSVFRRVLGADFDCLPPAVRRAHDDGEKRLAGRADVQTYLGVFGKTVCWLMGLPASGAGVPVRVEFTPSADGTVHWHRDFGGRHYKSDFSVGAGNHAGKLIETMGVIAAVFAVELQGSRLRFEIVGCKLLGIPLPRLLSPRCIAYESEQDGAFMFDITIGLPIFGRLIAYKGVIR
jgi:hypothetical protein